MRRLDPNKMTHEIIITNIFNEVITVKTVNYNMALNLIRLTEDNALLMDDIGKKFASLYSDGLDINSDKELKTMLDLHTQRHEEINSIRELNNYWYCGIDNLDSEDIEQIKKTYPRRNN